jgi:hypothetical protein
MELRPPPVPLASIVFRLLREPSPSAGSAVADVADVCVAESQTTKPTMFHPSYDMALRSGWRPRSRG